MATTKRAVRNLPTIHQIGTKNKRDAEQTTQDLKGPSKRKRTAFGDITNAKSNIQIGKKGVIQKTVKKSGQTKKKVEAVVVVPKANQEVGYDIIEWSQSSQESSQESNSSSQQSNSSGIDIVLSQNEKNIELSQEKTSEEIDQQLWEDVDAENMGDPFQVALYADHIFKYYKEKEEKTMVKEYLQWQTDLSTNMRAILVDWLVEVQENFELNHETLYLAVKLVDHYLEKSTALKRDKLQLVGATALFIACKFDERCPPVLDDFLYICDDAYNREELLEMERTILRAVDFFLGMPLSYRFLRRFAKCGRAPTDVLTLGRYILETSLMHYDYLKHRESEMAAAALLLAQRMKKCGEWTPTLVHYSGYQQADLLPLVTKLNAMIAAPASKHLATIRSKYSHQVFHEVAKTPVLTTEDFETLEKH